MHREESRIDGDSKIVASGDDTGFVLFDLGADPGERRDLAAKHLDELERMKRVYFEESAKIPLVEVAPGSFIARRSGGAPMVSLPDSCIEKSECTHPLHHPHTSSEALFGLWRWLSRSASARQTRVTPPARTTASAMAAEGATATA